MAIQFAVPSSAVEKQEERQDCRRGNGFPKPCRSCLCTNKAPLAIRSRGPLHDGANSNNLVVKLLPFVKRVALQLRGRLPAHVELDDLVSEGILGLLDAVRKFDPARGVTIESYARHRIRGAILDSLRGQDHASRDMRRRIKKIESTCQAIERRLGRPAGDSEMAEAMGLSLTKWYARLAELQRLGFEGPGCRISQDVCKWVDEEDLASGVEDDPFALCYRSEQRDILSRALGNLTQRERAILTLYYKDLLTMKQIGSQLGIDESRVSQLHAGAVARLRRAVGDMLRRPVPISGLAWSRGTAAAQA